MFQKCPVEMYTAAGKVQILAKAMSDPQLTPESSCCTATVLLQTIDLSIDLLLSN